MKKGLGRGLDALFQDNESEIAQAAAGGAPAEVAVADIEPNRGQPRHMFDEEKLRELADSIREHGVVSPLIVSELDGGRYRIIAGERRWRAARMAGLKKVPVVVRAADAQEIMEVSLIENLQREDLNIIEEAKGYLRLQEEFGLTQEQIARRVGKSRPGIANALRLLHLPAPVLELMAAGKLSPGHGKVLLSCPDGDMAAELAARAAADELSVRELEAMVKRAMQPKQDRQEDPALPYVRELETRISENLGRRAKVIRSGGRGRIVLEFYSDDDLTALAGLLSGGLD
mgnify:FL=1